MEVITVTRTVQVRAFIISPNNAHIVVTDSVEIQGQKLSARVSSEALEEFKQLYKTEYGVELDNQTAMEKAGKLLMLMRVVYRPIKKV